MPDESNRQALLFLFCRWIYEGSGILTKITLWITGLHFWLSEIAAWVTFISTTSIYFKSKIGSDGDRKVEADRKKEGAGPGLTS